MSKEKLSERMRYWRAERPSEWLMDEFIRDVEMLELELKYIIEATEHYHVNNGVDDACKECGLDLRNSIHKRGL